MSFDIFPKDTSPIIRQYIKIKEQYKDALVFFRVGDFYEMFYKDAEKAASFLGIALTRKGVKNVNIPMSGIPYHSCETYIERLVRGGFKIAICEQLETPTEAKKNKKEVVDRAVVRVITAGTITEEKILIDGTHNYLASIYLNKNTVSVAWVDISTGDFHVEDSKSKDLINIISRINPKEILIEEKQFKILEEDLKSLATIVPKEKFNFLSNTKILEDFFKINLSSRFSKEQVVSTGVLLDYLSLTQRSMMPQLMVPKVWNQSNAMRIDFFTRRSLEIDKKLNGEHKGSLKSVIDKTNTKAGKRLLHEWLSAPLVNAEQINKRLEVVDYFYNNPDLLKAITSKLEHSTDLVRVFTKLVLNRGGPKDLYILKEGLNTLLLIKKLLISKEEIPELIKNTLAQTEESSDLQAELEFALLDLADLHVNIKSGNFLKPSYSIELEEFNKEETQYTKEIVALQEKYTLQLRIPIGSLKIQNNNLMGHFIEVSSKSAAKILENKNFIHKQTLSNVVRFITTELMDLEAKLIKVQLKIEAFEEEVFNKFINLVIDHKNNIFNTNKAIALIDVLSSFASLALDNKFVKPIVNNSNNIKIIEGRHPVVEVGLKIHEEKQFISNNCIMDINNYICVITGPNMAGKSTFLRQNAIIIILAQIGCYVPASEAEIGIVDAVFSRVGSSDNLYQGQSTFMVEMLETATILSNATSKSFIILDEIGRGTATYDGLAIAFAVLYYLHNYVKGKVLFATHYHELTNLMHELKGLKPFYMKVESYNDQLIFMHNIVSGLANKSYGIYVAKIAGMPKEVILKASKYLSALEGQLKPENSLPLFENAIDYSRKVTEVEERNNSNFIKKLNEDIINTVNYITDLPVDELTPKQALEILYNIKEKLKNTTEII